jgi:hypothetical protein
MHWGMQKTQEEKEEEEREEEEREEMNFRGKSQDLFSI